MPIQQLNVTYGFSPLRVVEVDVKSMDMSKDKKYCGSDDGITNFKLLNRNFKDMPIEKCVPMFVEFHPSDPTPML